METRRKAVSFITREAFFSEAKRLIWLLLIPFGFSLPAIASSHAGFIEKYYSAGAYPAINSILRIVGGIVPFSIAEFLLYGLVLLLPLWLLYQLICALLRYKRWVHFFHVLITYLIIFGVSLNAYYLLWGFSYFRPPLSQLLELNVNERPVEELEALCISLSIEAKELRTQLAEDENGVFTIDKKNCLKDIPGLYKKLSYQNKLFFTPASKPKAVLYSEGMSWLGISGVYIAFTGEPNVNMHQPALLFASSAAHESAHGIGFAKENEANFVSYLACKQSDDAAIKYSGVMLALIYAGNELHSADIDSYKALYATYSDEMQRDLKTHSAYWRSFEGSMEETMSAMNDNYLKYNQQQSGVKSYGEIVDLLLAWREKYPGWFIADTPS